jgi:hypothetical protein
MTEAEPWSIYSKCTSTLSRLIVLAEEIEKAHNTIAEFKKLLKHKVISMNLVPFEVVVPIEQRTFRSVLTFPLRCVETDLDISEIVLAGYSLILRQGESSVRVVAIDLKYVTLGDLLIMACNLEERDLDAIIEAVREKNRVVSEDIEKLKELIAYSKLTLS